MTVGSALKFVSKVKEENDFRKKLYQYDSVQELNNFLSDESLVFTFEEFEEAIQKHRLEAQLEEIAIEYHEIGQWWKMLTDQLSRGAA